MVTFIESLPCYSLVLRDSFIANYKIILMLLNTQGELACWDISSALQAVPKSTSVGCQFHTNHFFSFFLRLVNIHL